MDSAVSTGKILAIGDNVCDKYLSRKKMYPGGQCVNTCAYAVMNGCEAAFLGKFGTDAVADCVQSTLRELGVDMSHCRHFQGENGFACITLINNERTFIGTNHGGVSRENPYILERVFAMDIAMTNGWFVLKTGSRTTILTAWSILRFITPPTSSSFSCPASAFLSRRSAGMGNSKRN